MCKINEVRFNFFLQVQRSREANNSTVEGEKDRRSIACRGVKIYRSLRPECEDDASIASHLKIMKNESKKRKKDYSLVSTAMHQTFADRRSYLIDTSPTVEDLKAEYPCLFDAYEVSSCYYMGDIMKDVLSRCVEIQN